MSDTWQDIQAFKSRQTSLREKLQKRKKEREDIVNSISNDILLSSISKADSPKVTSGEGSTSDQKEQDIKPTVLEKDIVVKQDPEIEMKLLMSLCDVGLKVPIDSKSLISSVSKALNMDISQTVIENLLQKFSAQELLCIKDDFAGESSKSCLVIESVDHAKLLTFSNALNGTHLEKIEVPKRKRDSISDQNKKSRSGSSSNRDSHRKDKNDEAIESLLSMSSIREKESKKVGEEILDLLSKPTAKERSMVERFRSQGGAQVQEFCPHGTKEECARGSGTHCPKLHFRKIIQKHTDETLGDCSFLNTCFHMESCKYVHYHVDYSSNQSSERTKDKDSGPKPQGDNVLAVLFPPQWVKCDLRFFDMNVLGKCAVVMADPPWDIHMELPYGTMSDDEMRQLNVPALQDEGLIFLWVTGRAMELGRECLKLWGYDRCDELIWVKTNQLQRIIRTGRTGHWLNHGKEHCLVGIKGDPKTINRGLDCDVIVAEVRATSHKPDEIYGIIERLSPGTRKVELFGRPHNVQPNWITLGNQVDGVRLLDPELVKNFNDRYPDGNCLKKN